MKRINLEQEKASRFHVENMANIFFKLLAISLIACTLYLWNSYFLNAQDSKEEVETNNPSETLEKVTNESQVKLEEPQIYTSQEIEESLKSDDLSIQSPSTASEKTNTISNNAVQSLEDITKDLEAEKAKNKLQEPEIDIESLGLNLNDEGIQEYGNQKVSKPASEKEPLPIVNVKEETKEKVSQVTSNAIPQEENKNQISINKTNDQTNKMADSKNLVVKNDEEDNDSNIFGPLKKIQKLLSDKIKSDPDKNQETSQTKKIVEQNAEPSPINAKTNQEPENDQKLQELRDIYLQKNEEKKLETNVPTPVKRYFSSYTKNQMAPLPIMSRYRTSDNIHIPTYPTTSKKIQNLFDTIKSGDVSAFNNAYQSIKNPNITNKFGDSTVTASILMQQHAILASSLAQGSDPNKPNGLNYTPIEIAIELLDFTSLELLIRNGADINHIDAFGRTYLMKAAKNGFLPAIEILTRNGTDINAIDNDGFTALSIAHRHKNELIVKFLLKNGAKIWSQKPFKPEKYFLIKELQNRWQ